MSLTRAEVVNLSASESMPDLPLAAAVGNNTEETHSVMDIGSGELLEEVQPLTTSDSLATLALHVQGRTVTPFLENILLNRASGAIQNAVST